MKNKFAAFLLICTFLLSFIFGTNFGYNMGVVDSLKENATANVSTPLYSEPNVNSSVIDYVISGDGVSVKETMCDFYKVEYISPDNNKETGWVLNSYILLNTPENQE